MEAYEQFLAVSGGKFPDQEFQARQRIHILENVAWGKNETRPDRCAGFGTGNGGLTAADLQVAKNEPNLEKRSRLALANADQAISEAREAYAVQNMKVTEAKLAEVRESVELAQAALAASGKKPGKSPGTVQIRRDQKPQTAAAAGWIKAGNGLRPTARSIEPVQNRVQEIHDAWLDGILTHAK